MTSSKTYFRSRSVDSTRRVDVVVRCRQRGVAKATSTTRHCSLLVAIVSVTCLFGLTCGRVVPTPSPQNTTSSTTSSTGNGKRLIVHSNEDAVKYLKKYGYLRCITSLRLRRQASSFVSDVILREDSPSYGNGTQTSVSNSSTIYRRRCSRFDVNHALKVLQTNFRLPVTGELNAVTKQTMNRGRCGNVDTTTSSHNNGIVSVDREPEAKLNGNWKHVSKHGNSVHDGDSRHNLRRVTRNAAAQSHHRIRHHNHYTEQKIVDDPPIAEWNDEDYHIGGNQPIVDVLSSFSGLVVNAESAIPTSGLMLTEFVPSEEDETRRRYSLLKEIKDRIASTEESSKTTADYGLSNDEPIGSGRGRRERASKTSSSSSSSSSSYERRQRRRRRSLRAVSVHDGTESRSLSGSRTTRFETTRPVRWRLLDDGIGSKIPLIEQKALLDLSFRMWSEVTPIKFVEDRDADISEVDIQVAFGKQQHMNCDKPFDGVGGELAHSWAAGDVHFDDDENYRRDAELQQGAVTSVRAATAFDSDISLQKLAVHEVGHVLGLQHNNHEHSIMYPIYVTPASHDGFELAREDRREVQRIYGVCKGSFDLTFDWLRRSNPVDTTTVGSAGSGSTGVVQGSSAAPAPVSSRQPTFIYNTYFFRGERYWMYENKFNRTRYGDPLSIEKEWHGLPSHMDAFTQVISRTGAEYVVNTYFFKGELYYKYADGTERVDTGYPRRIVDDFGSKSNWNDQPGIPNNVDAVWFDMNDAMLYFFQDEWVWVYDSQEIGRNGCCQARHRFTDIFPMIDSTDRNPLVGHVTTVYYSFHHRVVLMLRGEQVYELVAATTGVSGTNSPWAGLRRLGPWYERWFDICDVE